MRSAMVTMRRPCFFAKTLEIRHARHRAVVVHDLADDAGGREPGEAREIDGALGLPGAHEHAARARAEREDVAGRDEIARACTRGSRRRGSCARDRRR